MSGEIDGAIQLIRRISSELRPGILDGIGLIAAIEWQAERFGEKTGIDCRLSLPTDEFQLDANRSTALFRIFQEILTNVARHSDATEVEIGLSKDSGVVLLAVNDNGKGIMGLEIAETLSLNVKTVSTYRARLLKKLGLKTNADLTGYAGEHGLV